MSIEAVDQIVVAVGSTVHTAVLTHAATLLDSQSEQISLFITSGECRVVP